MILREMLVDDLDQVMKIENELFSPPWTKGCKKKSGLYRNLPLSGA